MGNHTFIFAFFYVIILIFVSIFDNDSLSEGYAIFGLLAFLIYSATEDIEKAIKESK